MMHMEWNALHDYGTNARQFQHSTAPLPPDIGLIHKSRRIYLELVVGDDKRVNACIYFCIFSFMMLAYNRICKNRFPRSRTRVLLLLASIDVFRDACRSWLFWSDSWSEQESSDLPWEVPSHFRIPMDRKMVRRIHNSQTDLGL